MKLVIFGLTVSSSWGNGHATIWRALCRALAGHGHAVVFFERNVPYYAAHRDLRELPWGRLELYEKWQEVAGYARRQLADADVAMVTSYCPDAIAASALVLDSPGLHVFYDLDTPVTLDEIERAGAVSYIGPRGLADFDLVLSYTGGQALQKLREKLGARRVAPLYGCADAALHRPLPPLAHFAADLSYIGTYAPDRQAALEELFLEPARRSPQRRFLIAGAKYPTDFPWHPNIFFVRHISPPDHPALYCSSRLTLNVTRAAMKRMGACPSGRLFEAAACGTPMISDWWEDLDTFFEPGAELLIARAPEDTLAALELSDAELRAMAERAQARTAEQHSADRRARELEAALAAARNDVSPERASATASAVLPAQGS